MHEEDKESMYKDYGTLLWLKKKKKYFKELEIDNKNYEILAYLIEWWIINKERCLIQLKEKEERTKWINQ